MHQDEGGSRTSPMAGQGGSGHDAFSAGLPQPLEHWALSKGQTCYCFPAGHSVRQGACFIIWAWSVGM